MIWKGKRVLVTGAGGFIGSHLAERLVEVGATTRAMVRYTSTSSAGWLEESPHRSEMEIVLGDIRDTSFVRKVVKGADVVFHLAALVGIPYSYEAPVSYVQTNVHGTLNVLEAARELGTERIVHTSTSEVYGTPQTLPITEEHPIQGQSPYSATKIGADKLAEAFFRSFAVPIVILRPFNTFGPRQSARAVIPTIITQCLTGTVVRLGNLYPTRDLNYVANTVDGYLKAGDSAEAVGKTIQLGSGRETSVKSLANLIAQLMGRTVMIEPDLQRTRPTASEVERLVADTTKAGEILGWQPVVPLEEGLRKTIAWMESHLARYRQNVYVI